MIRAAAVKFIRPNYNVPQQLTTTGRNLSLLLTRNNYHVINSNTTTRITTVPKQQIQKRMMAGDSHHLPEPQSENAILFGGHSTHPEGWETTIHIGYATSLILCIGILFFVPETGIDNWANQEARARLKLKEEHGWTNDMFQFGVHYQNLNESEVKQQWDKFSTKAVKMNEDDDDDEEEEEEEDDDDEEEDEE